MPAPEFLRNVYRILPNQQTVRLTPKNPDGATIPVAGSVRRPWSQQRPMPVGIESEIAEFLLPETNLGGYDPKNGDQIEERDGTGWIVVGPTTREIEGAIRRCPAVKKA